MSPQQKIAKAHRLSRRMTFRGLQISVETDKGEKRHWHDLHEHKSGTTLMKYPYGYIRRTEGIDGDHVDVYVGPNEDAKNVYVVHQMKAPDFKKFDEDKCMLGFDNLEEAKKAYLAHYDKPGFLGSITTMPFDEFKTKVLKTFEHPVKIATRLIRLAEPNTDLEQIKDRIAKIGLPAGAMWGGAYGTAYLGPKLEQALRRENKSWTKGLRRELQVDPSLRIVNKPSLKHPLSSRALLEAETLRPLEVQLSPRTPPSILAHELGHASGTDRLHQLAKKIPSKTFLASNILALTGALTLDPEHPAAKALPYAVALPTFLKHVPEEVRASWRGYRALRRLGYGRKALLSLVPGLATYLAAAATPAIVAEGMRRHRKKYGEYSSTEEIKEKVMETYDHSEKIAKAVALVKQGLMRGVHKIPSMIERVLPKAEEAIARAGTTAGQTASQVATTGPAAGRMYDDIMQEARRRGSTQAAQNLGLLQGPWG